MIRVNYTYLNSGGHPLYIHMHAAVTDADDEMIVVVSVVLLAKFFGASEYGRGCRSEGIRCFNSSHRSRRICASFSAKPIDCAVIPSLMYMHRRTIRKTRSFSFYQYVPIDHGTAGCSILSNRKPILTKMASGLATKTRTVCVCVSFFPIRLFVSDSTDTGRHISVIYKTLPMHSVCDEA